MTHIRSTLKAASEALLDVVGREHGLGHQDVKAARYVVQVSGETDQEVMLEKNQDSPPNLWIALAAAGSLVGGEISQRLSPAADLWTKTGKSGEKLYGRHSGLEKMPQLGGIDLICFTPRNLAEVGAIIDQIIGTSRIM